MVGEEKTIAGHWLGYEFCIPFSALTLVVGCQDEHLANKTSFQ